jgi:hypothetical protein
MTTVTEPLGLDRSELPEAVQVVRLSDPALRVLLTELDQRFRELWREQQEAQQLGVLRIGTAG